MLQCGDGELELLHFVEQHPHSSYIDRAMAALGGLYYASEEYGSAVYWLRKVNRALLPEDLCAAVEYRLGYALMREGQDREALALFEPLTYYQKRKSDALFYAEMCIRDSPSGDCCTKAICYVAFGIRARSRT